MKLYIKILLLALMGLLSACAAPPKDMRNGVLVDDWYTWPDRTVAYYRIDGVTHSCKYANGVVLTFAIGRANHACP